MIRLGKVQELKVVREKAFGVYLGEDEKSESSVLLPKRQVPEGTKVGDMLQVFIYKDSEDRLIATTGIPKLQVGQCGVLEVKDVSRIGAFLDMGLEKDLLLPFKEQSHPVKVGDTCLVALYVDRSKRLAATMKVYPYMSDQSPYHQDDEVKGWIYELNDILGAFVAVDNKYYGLIPKKEMFGDFKEGEEVTCRVIKVREDGKLDLSPRKKAYLQMGADAELILQGIEEQGGVLPFDDSASPEQIREMFHMSKNAFKRAVGRLLKEGKICLKEGRIKKLESAPEGAEKADGARAGRMPERSEGARESRGPERSEEAREGRMPERSEGARESRMPERAEGVRESRRSERSKDPREDRKPKRPWGLKEDRRPDKAGVFKENVRPGKARGPKEAREPDKNRASEGDKIRKRPDRPDKKDHLG